MFQVGESLGRPVYELEEDMPIRELLEYPAYWRWKSAEEKKQIDKARREADAKPKSKSRSPRRR
ncbi:MAG: hypothetical protein Q8K32_31340 [Archangium sp.]|nr:hypothetical protein [Archangium sp.]